MWLRHPKKTNPMKHYFTNEVKIVLDKLQIVKNLSRKKFVVSFILAMIKSRKVQFSEIAYHLNDEVKSASNETRIQDFLYPPNQPHVFG